MSNRFNLHQRNRDKTSTLPQVQLHLAFLQNNAFFWLPLLPFHALLGYLAVFLSRHRVFSVLGIFNEPDISGKAQSFRACVGTVRSPHLEHIMFITSADYVCSSQAVGLMIPRALTSLCIHDCFNLTTGNGQSWDFSVAGSFT